MSSPVVAEIQALIEAADRVDLSRLVGDADRQLPEVLLPGGTTSICQAANELSRLMGQTGRYFLRGGAVVTVEWHRDGGPILRILKPASAASAFESVARLAKVDSRGEKGAATCSEASARLILGAEVFRAQLPVIRILSPCPVLTERDGELIQIDGYDATSGILASGMRVVEPPVDEARQQLTELMHDFDFATPSDRSRAFAAIISPSLMRGDLLGDRVPIDLGEADESQAGKGYRHKVTAAIYGESVRAIAQRKGGVGSLEESFNSALIGGRNFISLDNVRGRIDSPAIESFLTEDLYLAREPYSGNVEIDPRRVSLMMTSNRAEMTVDLSNRASCVRIRKRPPGHSFPTFLEGDLLGHVRANQSSYLGAVFAIVRVWHAAGKPRSGETRHDFRAWSQVLDWIIQNLLGEAPLIEGHREAQARMASPHLSWLRAVVMLLVRAGRLGEQLRAHDILDVIAEAEAVEIPGLPADGDVENEATRESVLRALGRRLAQCFPRADTVEMDGFRIERSQGTDSAGRSTREYRVSAIAPHAPAMETAFPPSSAIPPVGDELSLASGGDNGPTQIAGPHGGYGGHAEKRESHGGEFADDCGLTPLKYTPEERRLLANCSVTSLAAVDAARQALAPLGGTTVEAVVPFKSAARDGAAGLIRDARRRGDASRAVALRDAWRERLAICAADDGIRLAEAERIGLDELRRSSDCL